MRDTMKSKNTGRGEGDEEEGDEEEGEDGKGPAAATVAADSSALALVRKLYWVEFCPNCSILSFLICPFAADWISLFVLEAFVCLPLESMPGSSSIKPCRRSNSRGLTTGQSMCGLVMLPEKMLNYWLF